MLLQEGAQNIFRDWQVASEIPIGKERAGIWHRVSRLIIDGVFWRGRLVSTFSNETGSVLQNEGIEQTKTGSFRMDKRMIKTIEAKVSWNNALALALG